MKRATRDKAIRRVFEIALFAKVLDGGLEIIAAGILFFFGSVQIHRWLHAFTVQELTEDPDNVAMLWLAHSKDRFSANTQLFAALFLLGHGLVKIGLVVTLLRDYRWAYPVAMTIFGLFVASQMYRYTQTHSIWLVALSLLDVGVIVLTWLEFRRRLPQ